MSENIPDIPDEYEVQTGSVLRVEPGRLIVRVERDDSECGGCRSCAVKSLCRGRDDGHMDLPVLFGSGEPPAREGEAVRIAYRAANPAIASIIMFVPALAGLFFGGFVGQWVLGEGDGNFLIGCLVGLVAGLGVSYVLARGVAGLRPDVRLLERVV